MKGEDCKMCYLELYHINGNDVKIGVLSKIEEGYIFKYNKSYCGDPIICFPHKEKEYKSNSLFPFFKVRLPDKSRKDIKTILHSLGLHKYDEFEILKRTKGWINTDGFFMREP